MAKRRPAPSVLCYGDSLTAGMHSNGGEFHPYARRLQRLLGGGDRRRGDGAVRTDLAEGAHGY